MTLLILENERGDCTHCRLYVEGRCYAKDPEDKAATCPLREVGTIEEKVRPLSKEHFVKVYIEGPLV